jgi:hypothetical protein
MDHKNLEYFMTTKVLNRRQACWAQELASMDFKIFYRKGTSNSKPDTLSRHLEYRPENGGGGDQPIQTVLNEKHFGTISAISTGGEGVTAQISIPHVLLISLSSYLFSLLIYITMHLCAMISLRDFAHICAAALVRLFRLIC